MKVLRNFHIELNSSLRHVIYAITAREIQNVCNMIYDDLISEPETFRILALDTERDIRPPHRVRVMSITSPRICAVISFTDNVCPRMDKVIDPRERLTMPESVRRLLNYGGAMKVGIAMTDEAMYLSNTFIGMHGEEILIRHPMDLQLMEKLRRRENKCRSLSTMVKTYFNYDLPKDDQCSNWRQVPLTQNQIIYSALDSLYCIDLAEQWLFV